MPRVQATDQDIGLNAAVIYRLSGSGSRLFHMDLTSGVVSVSEAGGQGLDRERKHLYVLEVGGTETVSGSRSIYVIYQYLCYVLGS